MHCATRNKDISSCAQSSAAFKLILIRFWSLQHLCHFKCQFKVSFQFLGWISSYTYCTKILILRFWNLQGQKYWTNRIFVIVIKGNVHKLVAKIHFDIILTLVQINIILKIFLKTLPGNGLQRNLIQSHKALCHLSCTYVTCIPNLLIITSLVWCIIFVLQCLLMPLSSSVKG
jgi:hypothetical protein